MAGGEVQLKDKGSQQQVVLAGGIAGLFSRFCVAPLDVVKIRLQLQTHKLDPLKLNSNGALPVIKTMFRNEGITGFWRGNVPAEFLYMTYGGAQFLAYRSVSQLLKPTRLPSQATSFVSGAAAGAAATAVTYPLDLLRTRFAAQGNTKVYKSFLGSFVQIGREEGFRGFFQGLGAGVGQIVPYMGLFFAVYESLRSTMKDLNLPFGTGDAAAGIMASVLAKTGVFPLDVIRKRLQVQGPARTKFAGGAIPEYERGVLSTGRSILVKEGWRGLYRGLTIGLIKSGPTSAITMWSYEIALKALMDNHIRD